MPRLPHVLGIAFAAALAAGVVVSSAPAAGGCPLVGAPEHTLTSDHFSISYYSDIDLSTDDPCPDYSTQTQAGDIAAYAERAYAQFRSWGYAAPATPINITLTDLHGPPALEGYADPTGITLATPTQIDLFTATSGLTASEEEQKAVEHEVFVAFELAAWTPVSFGDYWLFDGAAQWAAFQTIGYPSGAALTGLGPPDIALDCRDDQSSPAPPFAATRECDPLRWTEQGYTRWAFYQLLANKYGPLFMSSVLTNGLVTDSATTKLANALAGKGTSLASVFTEYANDLMYGNFGVPQLAGVRPPAYAVEAMGTKTVSTAVTVAKVPVSHLAARYVAFQRGDGDGSHACFAATLTVTVTSTKTFSTTSSQPYFYWDAPGSSPQALAINGSSASITVPWDTCTWGATRGWLSLPNASTGINAADFTVKATQSVDFTTPATATPPPDATPIWGTTVPVPTTDLAPTIDVFGPELIKVSAKSRVIRLIVESSGPGTVNATLGPVALGSGSLRAGNNDLRFTVPASMLGALRRAATAANVLTLTPLSAAGTVGRPVMRHVALTATVKAKKKTTKKK